jgi:NAD(P)-dependent dehydrogenase (short-subunit alcohol dehydrogenase family)
VAGAMKPAKGSAAAARAGRLAGKVALVTGGGGSIGRATALLFAAEGAALAVADLDGSASRRVAREIAEAGGQAIALTCDVSDSASARRAVAAAVRRLGALQVLVNNAACFIPDGTVADLDEALFLRSFAVNVTGPFLMSKWAIPPIAGAGGGSIIHVASQLGHVGRRLQTTYTASKAALYGLAKGMALDHAEQNIRVNTLSPGGIATPRMADQWGGMANAERQWGKAMHPLGRLGRVEEIARAALFLASDDSSFMTGADLLVDGGYTAL